MMKKKFHFYKKKLVKEMTPEQFKANVRYWQSRKAKARKEMRKVAGIGCPIFMTCSPEMNKGMIDKAKEKVKWARRELRFSDDNLKELRKMRKVI